MPIPRRTDFDAAMVRAPARKSRDGGQARRLLAQAAIYEGGSRTEAARIGGVTLQIARDWILKFNAHGPAWLIDGKAPGQPSRLNAVHDPAVEFALSVMRTSSPSLRCRLPQSNRSPDLRLRLNDRFRLRPRPEPQGSVSGEEQ